MNYFNGSTVTWGKRVFRCSSVVPPVPSGVKETAEFGVARVCRREPSGRTARSSYKSIRFRKSVAAVRPIIEADNRESILGLHMNIEQAVVSNPTQQAIQNDTLDALRALERHQRQITDVSFRIVSLEQADPTVIIPDHDLETPAPDKPGGFKNLCEWERKRLSFQLIKDGSTIWCVGGGDNGAYYGFLEAIQCLTGVIFSGVRDEDIVFGPVKPLPEGIVKPRFAYRCRDGMGPENDNLSFIRWMGRNRYNMWRRNSSGWNEKPEEEKRILLDALAMYNVKLTLGDHAMDLWLPESEFDEHPEWFGMRDGERMRVGPVRIPECPHLDADLPIQPCYSNPELQEFIVDNMAKHVAENPQMEMFGLWPHDGVNNWCQCSECLKKTPFEHTHALAMRLSERIPDTIPIELIAYSNLLNLPLNPLPPNDRIFIMLCPYLRHYKHRVYAPGGPEPSVGTAYPASDRINPVDEREYGALFAKWENVAKACGSELAIFEYGATFYDETRRVDRTRYFLHPRNELMNDEFSWYQKRGVDFIYLCGYYRGWPDLFTEHALATLLWGDDRGVENLATDYYQAIFGENGRRIRATLRKIDADLLKEQDAEDALNELKSILDDLPDSEQVRSYRLWIDYVRMGGKARKAELAGDDETVVVIEEEIDAFLAENRPILSKRLTPGALKYGAINKQRAKERLGGGSGKTYFL